MTSILKRFCKCCKKMLSKNYFKRHINTKIHQKNLSIKKEEDKKKLIKEAIKFPTEVLNIIMDYKEDIERNLFIHNIVDSVNNQLEKKLKNKSLSVYSRNILLDKEYNISIIRDILSVNINESLYIYYLYKNYFINPVVKFQEEKTTKKISFLYNPMVDDYHKQLMIIFG